MSLSDSEHLRLLIGEPIPDGKDDTATMFREEEIDHFLEQGGGVVLAAAYWGWLAKMAQYANLVTVNEGNAMREATELHKNAQRMVARFEGYVATPGKGRARVGRIVRRGAKGPYGAPKRGAGYGSI